MTPLSMLTLALLGSIGGAGLAAGLMLVLSADIAYASMAFMVSAVALFSAYTLML